MMCGAVLTTRSQSNPGSNPRRDQIIKARWKKPAIPEKIPPSLVRLSRFVDYPQRADGNDLMGLLVSRIDGVAAGEVTRQMGLGFCQLGQRLAGVTLSFNF